jgi:hypothetical protein
MAKTYQDAINEARDILQDTREPQRYTDVILLRKLNRALIELSRLRPDAFTELFDDTTGDIIVPEVVIVDATPDSDPDAVDADEDSEVALTDAFGPPTMFFPAIVYFITASAEILDDEFTTDGRAAMLMSQFKQEIVGL